MGEIRRIKALSKIQEYNQFLVVLLVSGQLAASLLITSRLLIFLAVVEHSVAVFRLGCLRNIPGFERHGPDFSR